MRLLESANHIGEMRQVVEYVRRVVMYLSEDMVQQSVICIVIHALVDLKQSDEVRGETRGKRH